MRYFTFDVCSLIRDYPRNKRTLAAIQTQVKACDKAIVDPIGNTEKGDWEFLKKRLDRLEAEFQMYVDMVVLGFNDLPEVERLVLQYWLIDNMPDEYIAEHCAIDGVQEVKKIKKIALTRFTNIVAPN